MGVLDQSDRCLVTTEWKIEPKIDRLILHMTDFAMSSACIANRHKKLHAHSRGMYLITFLSNRALPQL